MSAYSLALRLVGVGWFISSSVVIGLLGGKWLDDKTESSPLFVLSGVALGLLVSSYSIYKTLAHIIRQSDSSVSPLQEDDKEEGD
ncbi:AtpZ/AtpI family protein [SAR202 cluster bacterium AC-409-J13_OGT_754m]|nr:AtpZ/AtpI family protein [SAR202 cluster bacterium AC-409-J13_OGT_754m]